MAVVAAGLGGSPPRSPAAAAAAAADAGAGTGDGVVVHALGGEDAAGVSPENGVRDEAGRRGGGVRAEGEMDYKTFLDLVLAMENKQTRQVTSDEGDDGGCAFFFFFNFFAVAFGSFGFGARLILFEDPGMQAHFFFSFFAQNMTVFVFNDQSAIHF